MRQSHKEPMSIGALFIVISTLAYSVYPLLGKFVFAGGAGLSTILFVRFAITATVFWVILLKRDGFPRLPLRTWLALWGMGGIGYAATAGLYLTSVRYIPVSLASLLLYTFPILVTLLAILTRQEKLSALKVGGLICSTAGLALVLGVVVQDINTVGLVLALLSALTYGSYILLGNRIMKSTTPLSSSTLIATFTALTYGIAGLVLGGWTWQLSLGTWAGIGGITLFSTIIAMLTFFAGLKRVGATSASIISTLEPVMTVLLAMVFLQEKLTLLQGVGGLFVVLGGLLAAWPAPTQKPTCLPLPAQCKEK